MKKFFLPFFLAFSLAAQQPQTQTAPIYSTNAKYVQGIGPGYWPQAGAGLVLHLAAGRTRCGNTMTNYAAGTLTLTDNTTNYVFLDTASSCVPAFNTSGYTGTGIAIATVVTSSGVITSITDDRVFGLTNPPGSGGGSVTSVGETVPSWLTVAGSPITVSGTLAVTATTGQSSHQVIGTCNALTAFAPCTLVEGDLPGATVFTDQNATFGAHTYDFSGATFLKARVAAGLTTSANGDFGYDSTNSNWHLWNGNDRIVAPLASGFTSGDCGQPTSSSGKWTTNDAGGACGTVPFNSMLAPATVTPPVLGSLTWGNQNTATATTNAGGALYVSMTGANADNLVMLYKATPATPWTLVIGFVPGIGISGPNNGYDFGGLCIRESSTGKIIAFVLGSGTAGAPWIDILKYTNYTTYSGTGYLSGVATSTVVRPGGPVFWMSLTDDGTNYTWKTAIDGQNFKTILTKLRGDYFSSAGNQVGICFDPIQTSPLTDVLFVHWSGI